MAGDAQATSGKFHHLASTPETVHWGFWDGKRAPVLSVASGDRVRIDCVTGIPMVMPPADSGFHTPPEVDEIFARCERGTGNHILTGPIAVDGAMPGDVLEIRIEEIELRQDWGFNLFRAYGGTLPEDFPYQRIIHVALNANTMTGTTPWGMKVPLRPFFGQLGVAPKPEYGRQNSKEPREWGGNMDCRELIAGSTVFLPVQTKGALFSTGDGHAAQGDGEVDGTAVETALAGTFRFTVRKDLAFPMPRAITPTHYITFGLDADLDQAARQALRAMIEWLGDLAGLKAEDAYAMCSFVCDLHITQTVNNIKGVHAMIAKEVLARD